MPCYSNKKTISDVSDLPRHKRVILRLDLNVPVKDGKVTDFRRIIDAIPTVKELLEYGLKVIVLSHFSRVESLDDIKSGKKDLAPVAEELRRLAGVPKESFAFIENPIVAGNVDKEKIPDSAKLVVLQNTRYYDVDASGQKVKRESKNDPELAKQWAALGDLYIDDAFATSHRAHASTVGVAKLLPSAVGFLIEKEIKELTKAVELNEHPKVYIMGGAKVSDKLKLIKNILPQSDYILVGGGMAYTFLKAMGKEIGKSLFEADMLEECKQLMEQHGKKIVLPVDHRISPEFKDVSYKVISADEKNWNDMMALDIGPKTEAKYADIVRKSKVVIWNGPMGVCEFTNYAEGTMAVAEATVEMTHQGGYSLIGGGDTAAAITKLSLSDKVSYVSTGGGATLTFLEGSNMPALDVIPDRK